MKSSPEKGNASEGRISEASSVKNQAINQGINMADSIAVLQKSITNFSSAKCANEAKPLEVSHSHCRHGVVSLARMGVQLHFSGPTWLSYTGSREAMVEAGVLDVDQLPGNGYVHTKRFTNCLGQQMKVVRRGKKMVEVRVRLGSIFDEREFADALGLGEAERCMNLALRTILRAAGAVEVAA